MTSNKSLYLSIFIDSYGYELIKMYGNLLDEVTESYPLEMQFGYSATAIPTILTGKEPFEHGQFTFFYRHFEGNSIFKFFDSIWFKMIPNMVSKRRRFRVLLSRILKSYFNIKGYFDLYAVPFKNLKYFDYSEKNDLFAAKAFDDIKNLKDILLEKNIPHFISDWRKSEEQNFAELSEIIEAGNKKFIFAYFAGLDGIQHMYTKNGNETKEKLNWYKNKISALLNMANQKYGQVEFSIFSDHGMTSLKQEVNIYPIIDQLNLKFGTDYLSFVDSTMFRVWYLNPEVRNLIRDTIANSNIPGRFLSELELIDWGINFPDHKYGDDIFLVNPGVQLNPSDMGGKALPGMHGYDPSDDDSYAIWLSNYRPSKSPKKVKDIFYCINEKINEMASESKP